MKNAYFPSDTIAAVATPSGRGAVGLVRLSGPEALRLGASFIKFPNGHSLQDCPPRRACLAEVHANGQAVDRVMVTVFRAPQSYTGEDVVEISCHGGDVILKRVLELCMNSGARAAEPGEFSQRAFLNGKMDLAQAEAVADLINARTEGSRAAALAQVEGRLSRPVREVRETLVEMLAHLEVNLDHSDDATVGATMPAAEMERRLRGAIEILERLARSYDYGRLLKEGLRIAIVGRPNVGKSSLLNRLLGSDRAIVTDVPGTTRDTLEEGFDLYGIPAVLIDTAGIREHADPVEKIGIERTHKAIEQADAVILLLDQSSDWSAADAQLAELLSGKGKIVAALNKSDLPTKMNVDRAREALPQAAVVSVSSLKGSGVENLLAELRRLAAAPSRSGNADMLDLKEGAERVWVTSLRHRDALATALESLKRALEVCGASDMEECQALELRDALDSLGAIIGETVTEDILKEIFSKFCIGK